MISGDGCLRAVFVMLSCPGAFAGGSFLIICHISLGVEYMEERVLIEF